MKQRCRQVFDTMERVIIDDTQGTLYVCNRYPELGTVRCHSLLAADVIVSKECIAWWVQFESKILGQFETTHASWWDRLLTDPLAAIMEQLL